MSPEGGGGSGGGTPLEKPYRYVPPQKGDMVFAPFWSWSGVDFAHVCLESGMVFEGLRECMDVFVVSIPNKSERTGE